MTVRSLCLRMGAILPLLLSTTVPFQASSAAAIDTTALLHNSWSRAYRSPFGAVPAGTTVTLRFRTARGGADHVELVLRTLGPSGELLSSATRNMHRTGAGSNTRFQIWTTSVVARTVGVIRYAFRVRLGASSVWYSSLTSDLGGVGLASPRRPLATYALTVYDPAFHAPSWARDAIIYQIFPDRFYNGDPGNDRLGMQVAYGNVHTTLHTDWTERPTGGSDFFGGDLQGIIDKLPYLQGLGVNTLYLNPIFLAPSNHKYDTSNYLMVDPRFGTLETFKALLATAHADRIRIILDGVFNHTGSDSVYFNRYGDFPGTGAYQSKNSPYFSWYTFSAWPTLYNDWGGYDSLPVLNENPAVQDFIFRTPGSVAQYWPSLGTAGWRLDAADQKSHAWWQAFRRSMKAAYPDDILIGEATGGPIDALPWLLGNEMDGVMNYRFRDAVLGFFAGGRGTASGRPISASLMFDELMSILEEYPTDAVFASMNLVDSHDTERILTSVANNKSVLRLIATLQMTWKGAPTIYYGDEAGLEGGTDPDDRRTFPWASPDPELGDYYRAVIRIRNEHTALRDGDVSPLLLDNVHRVLAFVRTDATDRVVVVLNAGRTRRTLRLRLPGNSARLTDALSGATYTESSGTVRLTVPPDGALILVPSG